MKLQEIYFIVRVEVKSGHDHIDDSLQEMERSSRFFITNTPKVKLLRSEILSTKVRNLKNRNHGA